MKTVRQHKHNDPEPEADKWNSAIENVVIPTFSFFPLLTKIRQNVTEWDIFIVLSKET